jgi:hypothetical protein
MGIISCGVWPDYSLNERPINTKTPGALFSGVKNISKNSIPA